MKYKACLYDRLSLGLLVILILVSFFTVWDYGMSWDEPFRYKGGDDKLKYYQALFSGEEYAHKKKDKYPGLFDLNLAMLDKVVPFGRFYTGHLLSLSFGLMGIVGCWLCGRLLGGPRVAFWAALFLTMVPRYYGHMFFNPKDIPFAACTIWAVFAIMNCVMRWPEMRWRDTVLAGVCVGLTMSTRVPGMVVMAYLAGAMAVFMFMRWLSGIAMSEQKDMIVKFLLHGIAVYVIAWAVLLPWWPAAHSNPFETGASTVVKQSNYRYNAPVLYRGEFIKAQELPFYYILDYIAITTPEVILLSLVLGGIPLLSRIRQKKGFPAPERTACAVVILLAAVFPLAFVIIKDSTLYDGLRHLLFVLPPICCLAALSFHHLLLWLKEYYVRMLLPVKLAVAASLCLVGISMMQLHPYQYVYYNQLVGGLQGAYGRFETDYWGTSYREAVDMLSLYVAMDMGKDVDVMVAATANPPLSMAFFPKNFHFTADSSVAQFFISLTRLNLDKAMEGEAIFVVERMGVPLNVIRDRREVIKKLQASETLKNERIP